MTLIHDARRWIAMMLEFNVDTMFSVFHPEVNKQMRYRQSCLPEVQ
jgi:hypothetical protein